MAIMRSAPTALLTGINDTISNDIFLNDIVWKKGCNLETEQVDPYWYHLNYKLKSNEYLKALSFHGLTGVKWPLPLEYD